MSCIPASRNPFLEALCAKLMEGNVGRLGLPSTDEDSAYDSPRSTENSLSPTTPPKLVAQRLNNVSCSQCEGTLRDPRCLPCLHSFCLTCLQVKGKKVVCPECHLEFPLPTSGISGLLPDYGAINFLQSIKGKTYCTSCKSDTLHAVGKCTNCDSFLCSNCLMAHNFMLCFSGHRVIEFPKNNESLDSLKEEVLYCLDHPTEPVKYFCFPCNAIICQICTDESHLDTTHVIEDLSSIGGPVMNRLAEKLSESKTQVQEFEMCVKCNSQTIWCLHNQYSEIVSKINQIYEHHSAQLLKYKEQQLSFLDSAYNRMVSAIRSSSRFSEESARRLNHIADFFSRLILYGSTAQCLMYKKYLENEIANMSTIKPKPLVCNLRFDSNDGDFAASLSKNFGRIVCDMNGTSSDSNVPNDHYNSKYDFTGFPFQKYEKWSNSCFDDLKALSDLSICEDNNHFSRPLHIKSNVSRTTITYNWKFGMYGSLQGQFTEPNGVCINTEGDIIIADTNNNRVQVFDRTGKFKFCFGDGNNGDNGALLFPNRVAVMEKSGDIIVTERAPTHQVQVYNQYGQFIRKFGANVLQHPRAVAVDKEGHIIVVECKVMRVFIFDIMGNIKQKFVCNDTLHFPNGVAVNDKQEIFISDNRTHCVVVYNYQGKQLRTIGHEGLTNYPIGVMLNKAGQVIVADNHNNFNLTVFTQDGELITAFESKVKHAQCYDAAISSDGTVALTSKDYRVYVYVTSF